MHVCIYECMYVLIHVCIYRCMHVLSIYWCHRLSVSQESTALCQPNCVKSSFRIKHNLLGNNVQITKAASTDGLSQTRRTTQGNSVQSYIVYFSFHVNTYVYFLALQFETDFSHYGSAVSKSNDIKRTTTADIQNVKDQITRTMTFVPPLSGYSSDSHSYWKQKVYKNASFFIWKWERGNRLLLCE